MVVLLMRSVRRLAFRVAHCARECRALLFGLMLLVAGPVLAADCRVMDPELQGAYAGPCVNGLAQGEGTAQGSAHYTGTFVAGRKQGHGVKVWANGDRYEGAFADDRKHGYGVYVWGPRSPWAGQRYAGGYVNDRRHGAGVYAWPDGRELAGQWRDDLPPLALPPAMQATVRAYAERMVALSKPGVKVCRRVAVGTVNFDTVSGIVQERQRDQVLIRIDGVGRLSNQLDGRAIAVGDEVLVEPEGWFPCR